MISGSGLRIYRHSRPAHKHLRPPRAVTPSVPRHPVCTPRSQLDRQILRSHPRPSESKSLGKTQESVFIRLYRQSSCTLVFERHAVEPRYAGAERAPPGGLSEPVLPQCNRQAS